MNWNLIYVDVAFFGVWLAAILRIAPKVNQDREGKLKEFFIKIEEYNGKITEELFKNWWGEYNEIDRHKEYVSMTYRFGGLFMLFLPFAAVFYGEAPEEMQSMFFTMGFILLILFILPLSSLISWYIHEIKE